jgi:hypothetical protein
MDPTWHARILQNPKYVFGEQGMKATDTWLGGKEKKGNLVISRNIGGFS